MQENYEARVGNELERKAKEDEDLARHQKEAAEAKERHKQEQRNLRLQQMRDAGMVSLNHQLHAQELARAQSRKDAEKYAAEQRRKSLEAEAHERTLQNQRKE